MKWSAVLVAVALLAGCGGSDGDPTDKDVKAHPATAGGPRPCRLSVEPWWGAPADVRRAVADAIAEPGRPTKRERQFR